MTDSTIIPKIWNLACVQPKPLKTIADPDILAGEIIENIESGLNSFREIAGVLSED